MRELILGEHWFYISQHSLIICSLLSRGDGLWGLPSSHWHAKWWCRCSALVCTTILLRLSGCRFTRSFGRVSVSVCCSTRLLKSFCSLILAVSWALFVELCCRFISWVWTSHRHLSSAFWLVVDFCNGLYVLQREDSLMRARATLPSGYKEKYLQCS